jgi:CheY-like chemotaxis protein
MSVAEHFHPDILLLDIGLPNLDGFEVARRIRQQPWGEKIVLVAVTGWGQDEDRRCSKQAGFDFHVVKPVDPAALSKLLGSLAAG